MTNTKKCPGAGNSGATTGIDQDRSHSAVSIHQNPDLVNNFVYKQDGRLTYSTWATWWSWAGSWQRRGVAA